jgi:hypothetical protein
MNLLRSLLVLTVFVTLLTPDYDCSGEHIEHAQTGRAHWPL